MSFFKKVEISVAIALSISLIFSIFSFAETSAQIRKEILRLHVIANSDSVVDQNLKLAVRDALLAEGVEIFNGSVNIQNAIEKINPELERLKKTAKAVISERGFDYAVKITLSREYFTTRTYETVTLPAGEYLALRVVIGKGEGKNWWCVMFPPMCISAAEETDKLENILTQDEVTLVKKSPKFEPRFKIVELYETIKQKVNKFKK